MNNNFDLIPKSIFDTDFGANNVGWCSTNNINRLYDLNEGTVYVQRDGNLKLIGLIRRTRLDIVPCTDPKAEFIKHLKAYKTNYQTNIHESAIIGQGTTWDDGLIVEENVVIGANCSLNFDGFGFHNGELIPHRGRVVIKAGARIGNNVCIDRAVIGETIIGRDVKIDNLVHIAHGVKVGENSTIIAGAVVCGSVIIGKNVWVSPNASIKQHLKVGDNSIIGLGAVVIRDVHPGDTVIGCPAKPLKK